MKLGFGKNCITPKLGVELAGFGTYGKRTADELELDLYARAVALELDGVRAVLVECDLIGFTPELSRTIVSEIASRNGVSEDFVLLAVTHTHTGPATGVLVSCGEYDVETMATIGGKVIAAADAAFSDLTEVINVSINEGPFPNTFAHNRQIDENYKKDESVRTIRIDRTGAKPVALVNYSCHPVCALASHTMSADYPGFLCRHLEDAGFEAMYFNGFCGNINPYNKGKEDCAKDAGQRLFDVAAALLENGTATQIDSMATIGGMVEVDLRHETREDLEQPYEAWMEAKNPGIARMYAVRMDKMMHQLISDNPYTDELEYRALRLGKLLFVFHSSEVVIEFADMLRAAFPDYFVIFVGTAFATTRYLGTKEMMEKSDRMYMYESIDSCGCYACLPIAMGAGEVHFQKIIEQIKTIV